MSGKAENDAASMVVIMGVTGAGKSHFINRLAGK
jgi:predicted GTPase